MNTDDEIRAAVSKYAKEQEAIFAGERQALNATIADLRIQLATARHERDQVRALQREYWGTKLVAENGAMLLLVYRHSIRSSWHDNPSGATKHRFDHFSHFPSSLTL